MKSIFCLMFAGVLSSGLGQEWKPLFAPDYSDGDFDPAIWHLDGEGNLTAEKDVAFWTKADYSNFEVECEYNLEPAGNSGIVIYCSDTTNWIPNSVEIQLIDNEAPKWKGLNPLQANLAFFGHQAPTCNPAKPAGEWNRVRVTANGPHLRIVLNGILVNECDLSVWTSAKTLPDGSAIPPWLTRPWSELATTGKIGFQGRHAGAGVKFRNIRIRPCPADDGRVSAAPGCPYVASWEGRRLEMNPARISSIPFCRVWPGHQREISQTEMSHFVRFDLSASGVFAVRGPGVAKRLKRMLPLSEAEVLRKEGEDALDLSIARPGAYVLEFDGLPTLHVFADPPLAPVPAPGPRGRLIRFPRGEHSPGVVAPKSGDVVILDEGAVVYGSLFILNATNVTVTGRGIFDGSRLERSDEVMRAFRRERGLPEIDTESACFAYSVYGSENVTISGVTFRDPPFWTLVVRNQCRHTLIDNIHIVGNWRYNSDGVDVCASADTVIRNSFFRTFDDCVIARGPYMKGEHAPVSGMIVTNCTMYCDWGVAFKAQVQDFHGSTIEDVTMRDCRILAMRETAIQLGVRYGCDLDVMRRMTFEDLEFDFFPQARSVIQDTDDGRFVPIPLRTNSLAVAFSYTLGPNLDNQVNGPMKDPNYYRFIYEDFTFRRFRAYGETRKFNVRLESIVPNHTIRNVAIEDLPEHELIKVGNVQTGSSAQGLP